MWFVCRWDCFWSSALKGKGTTTKLADIGEQSIICRHYILHFLRRSANAAIAGSRIAIEVYCAVVNRERRRPHDNNGGTRSYRVYRQRRKFKALGDNRQEQRDPEARLQQEQEDEAERMGWSRWEGKRFCGDKLATKANGALSMREAD